MKKIKLKSIVAMLALFMAAVFVEVQVPVPTENTQEARFLGIGIKNEVGPCTFGKKQLGKLSLFFTYNWEIDGMLVKIVDYINELLINLGGHGIAIAPILNPKSNEINIFLTVWPLYYCTCTKPIGFGNRPSG